MCDVGAILLFVLAFELKPMKYWCLTKGGALFGKNMYIVTVPCNEQQVCKLQQKECVCFY